MIIIISAAIVLQQKVCLPIKGDAVCSSIASLIIYISPPADRNSRHLKVIHVLCSSTQAERHTYTDQVGTGNRSEEQQLFVQQCESSQDDLFIVVYIDLLFQKSSQREEKLLQFRPCSRCRRTFKQQN